MDIFDASEADFVLSRRARKAIGLALIIGIAFVPPVQRWYLGQIEHTPSTSLVSSRTS